MSRYTAPRTVLVLLAACALVSVTVLVHGAPPEPNTIVITATAIYDGGVSTAEVVLTVVPMPNASTLSDAKSAADGEIVYVAGLVATTSSSDFAGLFYAQQPDRAGGIGILWNGGIERGESVSVIGPLTTLHGERFIQALVVDRASGLTQ